MFDIRRFSEKEGNTFVNGTYLKSLNGSLGELPFLFGREGA